MLKLHGKDNQAVRPTSGKAPTQHQVRGDKHLGTRTSLGQDGQGGQALVLRFFSHKNTPQRPAQATLTLNL